jgi:hypothetical protein
VNDVEARTKRISVSLTPTMLARLEAYAAEHRWRVSTAVAILIEDALGAGQDQGQGARSR